MLLGIIIVIHADSKMMIRISERRFNYKLTKKTSKFLGIGVRFIIYYEKTHLL